MRFTAIIDRPEGRGDTRYGTEPILAFVFQLAVCFLRQQGRASVPLVDIQHFSCLFLCCTGSGCVCRSQAFVGSEFHAPKIHRRAHAGTGEPCLGQSRGDNCKQPEGKRLKQHKRKFSILSNDNPAIVTFFAHTPSLSCRYGENFTLIIYSPK